MITLLVFYPVDNDLLWGRSEFDSLSYEDAFRVLWANACQLDARFYNMSSLSYSDPLGQFGILNASEFAEDYNNEDYDGGWWVYSLTLEENLVKQIIEEYK